MLLVFAHTSCAYKMGYAYKELPRGIQTLHIPIFKNDTLDVGPEVVFTSKLIKEIKRAKVAQIVSSNSADGILEGRVISIERFQQAHEAQGRADQKTDGMVNLPPGTFVATEYLLRITVELRLRKTETDQIVWVQRFSDQTVYSAARLALSGINTSTPNYTSSEDERVMNVLANVMMQEAVGRLTENF